MPNSEQVTIVGSSGNVADVDSSGELLVKATIGAVTASLDGTATAAQPSYAEGTANPLSLTLAGGLRSDLQSISGTALTLGQKTSAASLPIVTPSDPDSRPVAGNITIQDTGSTTTTGQNSATIIIGTPTVASFQSQAINGQSTGRIMVSGTWTGTLEFDGSIDSGTTWSPIPARVTGTSFTQSSITGNGMFDADVSGLTNCRVRATAAVTGTAVVRFTFAAVGGPIQILNPVRLFDNSSGASATIKPASTAALATDTSQVVSINPNTPLPAGTNALGNVGGKTVSVTVTPTVTSATYAANVVVGGLLTFANLFSATGSGIIQSVRLNFTTVQTVGWTLYPFTSNPTNSTWTDHSAASINSADVFFVGPPINLANNNSGLGTMTNYSATGLGQAYVTGGTSGWFILVPTATSASLAGTASVVSLTITVLQDL